MNKTELLNRFDHGEEDLRLVLARILDQWTAAEQRSIPTHSPFLTPAEHLAAMQMLTAAGSTRHLFHGGYPDAERTICAFLPDWLDAEQWLEQGHHPFTVLRLRVPPAAHLSHRNWLGSILGVGLTREKTGDLLAEECQCQAIVLSDAADIIVSQLDRVDRWPVQCEKIPLSELTLPERTVKTISTTFASLRLDAVAASAFSMSRTKAAALISSGQVSLNHLPCTKPDHLLSEGDVLSCRGFGRCVVKSVAGQSRKGRTIVELERSV